MHGVGGATYRGGPETSRVISVTRMRLAVFAIAAGIAGVPVTAVADVAGTVDSLAGSVSVIRSGAPVQSLTTGASVNEGDQISTGADSWVLLEMADGGSLTLRGKTRMRIDAYVYADNNKTGSKSWLSLLEGAMRSVTGAIGAFNPPSYRLTTPVVTLGIRGTDHETAYYPAGSTEPGVEPGVYDKVNQGETVLHSQRGDVSLKAGQAGFSDHRGASAPRVLTTIPAFYKRHAEMDRPLANRMRLIQARREKKIEIFRQRMQHRTGAAAGDHARMKQNHGGNDNGEIRRERAKARQEALKDHKGEGQAKGAHERKLRRQDEPR
jgi:FecR protein